MKDATLFYDLKLGFRCKVYDTDYGGFKRNISFVTNDQYLDAGQEEAQSFAKEATRLLFLSLTEESQKELCSDLNDRLSSEFGLFSGDDYEEGAEINEDEQRH
jgi:hypothetical protein